MVEKQKSEFAKAWSFQSLISETKYFFSKDAGKLSLIILIACLVMVAYLYFNQSAQEFAKWLVPDAVGDTGAYVLRFASSFLLLGLVPFFFSKILGYSNKDIGLVFSADFLKSKIFWLLAIILWLITMLNLGNQEIVSFYPFSKTLVQASLQQPWFMVLHSLAYLVLYYLPWELLFRGILVLPFLRVLSNDESVPIYKQANFYLIASLQTIPTVLMHLPHPLIETIGTIPFGFIAAWLVLRFKSILPVLCIHASVGISLDIGIMLKHAWQL